MFNWWRKWEYRDRLAQEDATILIARYEMRASYIANRRVAMMRNSRCSIPIVPPVTGSVFIPLHANYCRMTKTMGPMVPKKGPKASPFPDSLNGLLGNRRGRALRCSDALRLRHCQLSWGVRRRMEREDSRQERDRKSKQNH
jgi:hypothetical protein